LAIAVVTLGVAGFGLAPASLASGDWRSCSPVELRSGEIVTTRFDRIHALHVKCGLAHHVAKQAYRAHRVPGLGPRYYTYGWHRFRCNGYIASDQTIGVGTTLRWHCHRKDGRQRVRFREIVVD
jgi:hypothetical protein